MAAAMADEEALMTELGLDYEMHNSLLQAGAGHRVRERERESENSGSERRVGADERVVAEAALRPRGADGRRCAHSVEQTDGDALTALSRRTAMRTQC